MSTAQQAARGRAAYRRLLRAVDTHITAVGGNTTWRDAVRHRFREARSDAGPAVETALRRAEDLAFMVNSVNEHKNLLISYGISLDKEQQARERVKNTAARVGLSIREQDYLFRPDGTETTQQPPS